MEKQALLRAIVLAKVSKLKIHFCLDWLGHRGQASQQVGRLLKYLLTLDRNVSKGVLKKVDQSIQTGYVI